jgi:signal transduction histidine kinase
MNDSMQGATRGAVPMSQGIDEHAANHEASDHASCGAPAELQHLAPGLPDAVRGWRRRLQDPERGTQSGNTVLVGVFTHELRNSLGAIRSATRILGLESSGKCVAAKARTLIERQVAQMTVLVEDLLEVSRSQQLHLRFQRSDLCAVVGHAARTVEFTMQQRGHRMTHSFPAAPVWVQADAARLEQVLVNLLYNAAKYTDPGGDIGLSVEQQEGAAVVRVRDTGIGIDPDILPHVFDLFVQADPSSHRAEAGLGIGLALVRNLVERHGGSVSAASAGLGCGSEFAIRLPSPGAV